MFPTIKLKPIGEVFKYLCLFSLLLPGVTFSQTGLITGRVIDANTHKILPFVSIISENVNEAVTADIDGRFKIKYSKFPIVIKASYVGYTPVSVVIQDSKEIELKLEAKSYSLKEVEVKAGDNPAHRIIKKVIANKDLNNPEHLKTFSYNSYTKLIAPTEVEVGDTSKFKGGQHKHLDKHYDFFMETYTARVFKEGKSKEKVLSTKVSGLQDPTFGLLETEFQSFSFYKDAIDVMGKNYVTPISSGAIGKYFYLIEDTAYNGEDTVFVISYRPYKNRNFDGLKGLLYINTNGYAIQSVTASPSDNIAKIGVKIEQLYTQVDGQHWFPAQLNTGVILSSAVYKDRRKVREDKLTISGKSYLSNIVINKEISDKEFDEVAVSYEPDAAKKSESYWQQVRTDSLDKREKATYHVVDSIGRKYKLDDKVKFFGALFEGRLPLRYIDLRLDKILNFNDYEGFRLGIGAVTNDKFSKRFNVGGYVAYGFKDQALKYGTDATVHLYKPKQLRLLVEYQKDVYESGGTRFYFDEKFFSSDPYRDYLVLRMDRMELKSTAITFRALQSADVRVGVSQYSKGVTNDYRFEYTNDKGIQDIGYFRFTEINIATRIAIGERFAETMRKRISLGTKYPILWLQLNKGFRGLANGMFEYNKVDAKLEKSFYTIGFGKTTVQAIGGYIDGNIPYANLYNGHGSNKQFTILAENSFQTAGMNEFIMSEYLALHASHNFGKLLYRGKWFKPELLWINNAGWGRLNNPASHKNIDIKTMEKGLFETGLAINNLITQRFFGYGVGFFYRYGPYRYNDINKDLSIQLSISLNL